jgi:hypothetical protein
VVADRRMWLRGVHAWIGSAGAAFISIQDNRLRVGWVLQVARPRRALERIERRFASYRRANRHNRSTAPLC